MLHLNHDQDSGCGEDGDEGGVAQQMLGSAEDKTLMDVKEHGRAVDTDQRPLLLPEAEAEYPVKDSKIRYKKTGAHPRNMRVSYFPNSPNSPTCAYFHKQSYAKDPRSEANKYASPRMAKSRIPSTLALCRLVKRLQKLEEKTKVKEGVTDASDWRHELTLLKDDALSVITLLDLSEDMSPRQLLAHAAHYGTLSCTLLSVSVDEVESDNEEPLLDSEYAYPISGSLGYAVGQLASRFSRPSQTAFNPDVLLSSCTGRHTLWMTLQLSVGASIWQVERAVEDLRDLHMGLMVGIEDEGFCDQLPEWPLKPVFSFDQLEELKSAIAHYLCAVTSIPGVLSHPSFQNFLCPEELVEQVQIPETISSASHSQDCHPRCLPAAIQVQIVEEDSDLDIFGVCWYNPFLLLRVCFFSQV